MSVVIGFALLEGGLGSRSWAYALSALGFFYGVVGAWYLGVSADLILCAGSAFLAAEAFRLRRSDNDRPDA